MSARERILARLRRAAAQGGDAAGAGDRLAAVSARLGAAGAQGAPAPAQSRTSGAQRRVQFEAKLAGVDASVTHVATMADLPEALAAQLRDRNLARAIRMGDEPDFAELDWSGFEATRGPGRIEEPATLSRASFGVAETGTLALLSGPDNPVTLTFLGETHFVVLGASQVVAGLDDLWAGLRVSGADPRTVNLVTGPSRSADIGQVLQLGAHGPVALHVFVVDDA